jgi:phage gp16-like protein
MPPSKTALAKIHIAKKDLGLSDEAYRDILHLHFQVDSAASLDERQATVLLNTFRARGWLAKQKQPATATARQGGGYIAIKPGPAAAQQRKVLALWNALGYPVDKLHSRCHRQFNVDRFEWLTEQHHLHVLITDLQGRLNQSQRKRSDV